MRRLLFACATFMGLAGLAACDDVVGPTGDPVDLSFTPCAGASSNPSWLAVQDGDGAWQRISSTGGGFDFTIGSGRAGVAMYDNIGLLVFYATTEELQSILGTCTGSVRDIIGTVTGYTSADRIRLTVGGTSDEWSGAGFPAPAFWGFSEVDPTTTDLVAVRFRFGGGTTTTLLEEIPNAVLLRRNVTGSTTDPVDLSSATESFAPVLRELAVTNIVANEQLLVTSYIALSTTAGQVSMYQSQTLFTSGIATAPFYGVPEARLSAGESHFLVTSAMKTVGNSTESRTVGEVFTSPSDRSLALGAAPGPVTVAGTSRPSATYTVQSDYDNLFQARFAQPDAKIDVVATKAYFGATVGSPIALAVPDLNGVAGFSPSWLLAPGEQGSWFFRATDAPLAFVLPNTVISFKGAERSANFTP